MSSRAKVCAEIEIAERQNAEASKNDFMKWNFVLGNGEDFKGNDFSFMPMIEMKVVKRFENLIGHTLFRLFRNLF